MDDRMMQFRVGAVVLGVVLITGVLTVMFGHMPGAHYTIYVDFANAPGVAQGTPVKDSGVLIGRVTDVQLREGSSGEPVHVTLEIESKYKIRANQTIQVSSGLLGDTELDVVDQPRGTPSEAAPAGHPEENKPDTGAPPTVRGQSGDPPQAPGSPPSTFIQPGQTIKGTSAGGSPSQEFAHLEADMDKVSNSLTAAGDEVRELAHNLNTMFGDGDPQKFRRLVDKTEGAMDAMQKTLNDVDKIVGDPKMQADMRRSLADLPETLRQLQQSLQSIQTTTALADENLKNLQGFTRPLSEQGGEMVRHANSSIRELDELLGQVSRFTTGLNSSQGTLGQLINSPELYQQLAEAAANVNELTRRMAPILNDVRTFTDRIARHPEVLGVRGAIDRSPGIK